MEVKGDGAILRFRAPKVPELLRLYEKMGMSFQNTNLEMSMSNVAVILEEAGPLMEEVSVNINGKVVTSYEELLGYPEALPLLTKVAIGVLYPESLNDDGEEVKNA